MITVEDNVAIICPPQELTIRNVGEFVDECREKAFTGNEIALNLIGVYEIDSSGIQSLIALKNESNERKMVVNIVGMSSEVDEMLSVYNVTSFMSNQG